MICDRCGEETVSSIMSMFNLDQLCPVCEVRERNHPRYLEAKRVEGEEARRGNYNFRGIGLPKDLR